jgi:hypothetical protein
MRFRASPKLVTVTTMTGHYGAQRAAFIDGITMLGLRLDNVGTIAQVRFAESVFPSSGLRDMMIDAGAYTDGKFFTISREKFLSLRDNLVAESLAAPPPTVVPSLFPDKYFFSHADVTGLGEAIVTQQAQGFAKLDWPGLAATVKIRRSGTAMTYASFSGAMTQRSNALVATIRHFAGEADHDAKLSYFRFVDDTKNMPVGIRQMLMDHGGSTDGKNITLTWVQIKALRDAIDADLAGVPGITAATPAPTMAAPAPTPVAPVSPAPAAPAPAAPAPPPEPEGPLTAPKMAASATGADIVGPTMAPKKPTPAFIYGFDPDAVKAKPTDAGTASVTYQGKGGKPVTEDKQVLQVGTVRGFWSRSPTGGRSGLFALEAGPGTTDAQMRDAAFAILRHMAEEGTTTPKGFFVQPDFYDKVPGLRQMILDAGGQEADFPNLGTAVQMTPDQAKALATALQTNVMGPITPGFKTSSDYLLYGDTVAKTLFAQTPKQHPKGLTWKVEDKSVTVRLEAKADWSQARLTGLDGGDDVTSQLAVVAQINWLAEQGAGRIEVGSEIFSATPAMRQWLLAVGGKVHGNVIRLDDEAISVARRTLTKNALPVPLGGAPLPYSIVDELNANIDAAAEAMSKHIVTKKSGGSSSAITVGTTTVRTRWTRSSTNIHWQTLDRGTGTIGTARAAAAAQLRAFANDIAQHAGMERLDVAVAITDQLPGLRSVLRKYGAAEVPDPDGAYWSLTRAQALKMRNDLEAEWHLFDELTGTNAVEQRAGIIHWPTVEELAQDDAKTGRLGGQTKKSVFVDKDGNEWLFKPGHSGRGAVTDYAAAELAELLGLPLPPVRIYSLPYEGRLTMGSLQKMVPGKGTKLITDFDGPQMEQVLRHSVLDWLINNDDAHIGNWIIGDDGTVWAIDKTRSMVSWRTSHDVLDSRSTGNGPKPTMFEFFMAARQDPSKMAMVHPTTITSTLRKLEAIDDDVFRRLMKPVTDATDHPNYKGNPDKLLDELVARKHSAAVDFENYFRGEIESMLKRNPTAVPPDWKAWHKAGGHFNLNATPEDLWREELSALEGEFGKFTAARYKQVRDQIDASAMAVLDQFVDGGLAQYQPGTSIGGHGYVGHKKATVTPEMVERVKGVPKEGSYAPNYIPLLIPQRHFDEWMKVQTWALLSIADGAAGPKGASYDQMLRSMWDPATGTFIANRGSGRFHSPKAAYDDLVKSQSKMAKSYGTWSNTWGGQVTYGRFHYSQIITTDATDITRGEHEWIIRDIRPDNVIAITSSSYNRWDRAKVEAHERSGKRPWETS